MWEAALFLVISIDPLLRAHQSAWMLKLGLVCAATGVFALAGVSPLASNLRFLLRLPLFPIFGELQRGAAAGEQVNLASVVAWYWALGGWLMDNVSPHLRGVVDDAVTVAMWAAVVRAFRNRAVRIVPLDREEEEKESLRAVHLTAAAVCLCRFVPPSSFFAVLLHAYAAHCAIHLLSAAQADEGGNAFRVRVKLLLGFIPFTLWVSPPPPPSSSSVAFVRR